MYARRDGTPSMFLRRDHFSCGQFGDDGEQNNFGPMFERALLDAGSVLKPWPQSPFKMSAEDRAKLIDGVKVHLRTAEGPAFVTWAPAPEPRHDRFDHDA